MAIEGIMRISKAILLKCGEYPPTMFVDFTSDRKGKQYILDNDTDDLDTFHKAVFLFAREASEQLPGEDIASLCFVCECEAIHRDLETKDVTEQEVLLFQMLEVLPPEPGSAKPSLKLTLHFVEMIRDGAGNLIDLLPDDDPKLALALDEVTPPAAFLAGWKSARMSEKQQWQIIAKAKKAGKKRKIAESWGSI